MQDTRVLTIGTDVKSWSLSGEWQIAGITIDNKSGSWLLIPQDNTFIPPYTLGFAHSFQPSQSRVDIKFVVGPAGQLSTQAGDSPIATIYDRQVGEAVGTPNAPAGFIEQFTPTLTFVGNYVVPYTNLIDNVLAAAVANKRYRVLTAEVQLQPFSSIPPTAWDTGCRYGIYSPNSVGTPIILQGRLNVHKPMHSHVYPAGNDVPISGRMNFYAAADWAQTSIGIVLTAQLI